MNTDNVAVVNTQNKLNKVFINDQIKASPFITAIVGFSGLLIYFAWDTSFNMQVLFPIIAVVLLWYLMKTRGLILINTDFKLICGTIAVYVFSLFTNYILSSHIVTGLSFIRVVYMAMILLYYYLIMRIRFEKEDVKLIVLGNVISGVFISFLIILNWLNGAVGKISLISVFGISIEENYTGSLISFSAVLSFIAVINKVKFRRKIGYFISLVIMLFAVCLTGSRAAILALAAGCFIVLLVTLFSHNVSKKRKIFLVILVAVIAAVFLLFAEDLLPDNLYKRIFSILNGGLRDNSNSERVSLWMFALKNYIYRPFFGYGVGNFSVIASSQPEFAHHTVVVAHNTWIDFLIDGGLVGFILIIALIYKNIKNLLNTKLSVFWSLIIVWLFESLIIGGERTFFFWNSLIFLSILSHYFSDKKLDIKKLFN